VVRGRSCTLFEPPIFDRMTTTHMRVSRMS